MSKSLYRLIGDKHFFLWMLKCLSRDAQVILKAYSRAVWSDMDPGRLWADEHGRHP